MERLEQLYNMLATTVYLERPSHLALVISIWRRSVLVTAEELQRYSQIRMNVLKPLRITTILPLRLHTY